MADEATTAGIAALISGFVVAIDRAVAKILGYFKKRDSQQAEAQKENVQWDAIHELRSELKDHRLETTRELAMQGTKLDMIYNEIIEVKRTTARVVSKGSIKAQGGGQ